MKAIILAAGRSPRLLPLTKDKPLSLLKINEKTVIEHQIESLKSSGIDEIVVVTGHCAEQLENALGEGVKYIFNPFFRVSGVAMSLWIAKNEMDKDFIFLYGDVLFDKEIVKKLVECEGDICLVVDKKTLDEESEKVKTENGLVTEISKTDIKKEEAYGEFIGLAKFTRNGCKYLIDELDKVAREDINAYFIAVLQKLLKRNIKMTFCEVKNEKWADIDFKEDLEKAKKLFK